jgi:5-methylcytosine-specific restriction endonuclease McrBC regulatory subunit McrC
MIEIFELSLGRALPLNEISEKLSKTTAQILEITRSRMDEYTLLFGVRPLNLEYRPEVGFLLRADSQIGFFVLDFFAIRIIPKVEGLELSKVLMMAQKTNSGFLNIENKRIQATLVSDSNFSGFDLLSVSFLDCIGGLVRDSIIFGWDIDEDPSNANQGQIQIDEWVSKGKGLPIPRTEIGKNPDIPINRYLLKALKAVADKSSILEVKSLASELEQAFDGVSYSDSNDSLDFLTFQVISYPRADYKRAFIFAKALLEGGFFQGGFGLEFMPSFVLNLDVIFEEYCAFMLTQTLNPEIYDVEVQKPVTHESIPELQGEIQPDIVVRNRANSKCVVIDTKNKSVLFQSGKATNLPSQDIYQLVYYSQRLNSQCAMLLYPAVKTGKTFPIQGSESPEVYENRIDVYMQETSENRYLIFPNSAKVNLVPWQIDLSGNLENTELSIAGLAFFIGNILK